jgi:hypothetical protein
MAEETVAYEVDEEDEDEDVMTPSDPEDTWTPDQSEELRNHLDQVNQHLEQAENANPPFAGSPGVADFIGEGVGHRGAYIVDEAAARESGCIGYALREDEPEHADLVFLHHGAVGALSKDQQAQFCPTVELRPVTPEMRNRILAFKESASTCSTEVDAEEPKGERLGPFLSCMSKELRSRGEKL